MACSRELLPLALSPITATLLPLFSVSNTRRISLSLPKKKFGSSILPCWGIKGLLWLIVSCSNSAIGLSFGNDFWGDGVPLGSRISCQSNPKALQIATKYWGLTPLQLKKLLTLPRPMPVCDFLPSPITTQSAKSWRLQPL